MRGAGVAGLRRRVRDEGAAAVGYGMEVSIFLFIYGVSDGLAFMQSTPKWHGAQAPGRSGWADHFFQRKTQKRCLISNSYQGK